MKCEITATESLEYIRKFIVDIPDDMEEETLDAIPDVAEAKAIRAGDVQVIYSELEEKGCKIVEYADDSIDSPDRCDIVITDFNKAE